MEPYEEGRVIEILYSFALIQNEYGGRVALLKDHNGRIWPELRVGRWIRYGLVANGDKPAHALAVEFLPETIRTPAAKYQMEGAFVCSAPPQPRYKRPLIRWKPGARCWRNLASRDCPRQLRRNPPQG